MRHSTRRRLDRHREMARRLGSGLPSFRTLWLAFIVIVGFSLTAAATLSWLKDAGIFWWGHN